MDLRRRLIVRAYRMKSGTPSCGRLDLATYRRRRRWGFVPSPLPGFPASSPRWSNDVSRAAPGRESFGIAGEAEADETIELSHLLEHLVRDRLQLRPGADVGPSAGGASLDGAVELRERLGVRGTERLEPATSGSTPVARF